MTDEGKPVVVELGIEFVVELLLFLYPYGADQMELPHNFWLGLGCWIVGAIIGIRMFWIFPLWAKRLPRYGKIIISFVAVAVFATVFYRPVLTAYAKWNTMDKTGDSTPSSPLTMQMQNQPSGAQPSPQAPSNPKPTPPKPTKKKNNQSAKVGVKGNNNTAGAVNQEGNNNTAIVGSNNTVSGASADDIAARVADRLGPTVKGGFHETTDRLEVSLGSLTVLMDLNNVRNKAIPFRIQGAVPFRLRIKDDRLLFSFESWDANLPIKVEENEVRIGSDLVDRNFSANAFEVVNEQAEPIFQMIRKNATSIQINGIFPSGMVDAMGRQSLMWAGDTVIWNPTRPVGWRLKPIFKYPSWKYPGVFADN